MHEAQDEGSSVHVGDEGPLKEGQCRNVKDFGKCEAFEFADVQNDGLHDGFHSSSYYGVFARYQHIPGIEWRKVRQATDAPDCRSMRVRSDHFSRVLSSSLSISLSVYGLSLLHGINHCVHPEHRQKARLKPALEQRAHFRQPEVPSSTAHP